MAKGTLRQMIGQLMVVGFQGKTPSPEITRLIQDYHLGGIILFARNIGTAQEVLALTSDLQRIAKEAGHEKPLLICVDQENGIVRRLGKGTTYFPGSMLIGATGNPQNAYDIGYATGIELRGLGINWNLAPVVDVNNNPHNPVIGVRSFGEDCDKVAELAVANIRGMHDAGIITTLKHFPGHGDTDSDSHLKLPIISHDMDRLESLELVPFRAGMEAGADTIMSAHVYFPALVPEERPATLSREVMTGLLRESLGFRGVVTTDCMEMNAIAETYGTVEGAVAAVKAGVDVVMISHTHDLQEKAILALEKEVEKGQISRETIEASYQRVMALKERYLTYEECLRLETPNVCVGSKDHALLAKRVFLEGITIAKNDGILPLSLNQSGKILYVDGGNKLITGLEDPEFSSHALGGILKKMVPSIEVIAMGQNPTEEERRNVLQLSEKFDKVIFGTFSMRKNAPFLDIVQAISKQHIGVIVMAMRNPYHLADLPHVNAFIATYEWTRMAIELAVRAVLGLEEVSGKLPVMGEVSIKG